VIEYSQFMIFHFFIVQLLLGSLITLTVGEIRDVRSVDSEVLENVFKRSIVSGTSLFFLTSFKSLCLILLTEIIFFLLLFSSLVSLNAVEDLI